MSRTMRQDSRQARNIQTGSVQAYHEREHRYGDYESYAYQGFESNKYFRSDRPMKLDENFNRPDRLPLEGFGLEIETECNSMTTDYVPGFDAEVAVATIFKKVIFPVFPPDLFKMQRDSSLNRGIGIECITQVMTRQFIRNHYKDFKAMYSTLFPLFGISCSRSGNCGMHCNISNAVFGDTREKQVEAIRKLHYIINRHFTVACKLFKRDQNRTGYCAQMPYENARTMEISGGSHYVCMNYSHFESGRIELRLVGGQPDYYAFRNTMECIFFLCDRVKKIAWSDLDDLVKVFRGCNQYVIKRLADCGLTREQMNAITATSVTADLELR